MSTHRGWGLATIGLIGLVTIGIGLGWDTYPRFLDSYYHLAVIQGFRQAGGIALHAFWESAPAGRPHLYPPLFHLVWAPLALLVRDPIAPARCWTLLGTSLLLVSTAWATRQLFGGRRAFFTTGATLPPA